MSSTRWTDSQVRVYTLLTRLCREQGTDTVTLSRAEVGRMTGLTDVTAKQAMDRLEDKGLVRMLPRHDNRSPNLFRLHSGHGLSVVG